MTWHATHEIPAPGLDAYPEPDPALTPTAQLPTGLRLHRVEERGAWALVRADNGWQGWVDGRRLVAVAMAAPEPPAPPAPVPPTGADVPEVPPTTAAPYGSPVGSPAAGGQPLGAAGGIPSGFAPSSPAPAAAATSSAPSPLAIAAAVCAAVLVVGFLLAWITFGDASQNAFEASGDAWRGRGNFGGRTKLGIFFLQLVWPATVLAAVGALLSFLRHTAATVVTIAAGVVGLVTVIGRLLLDFPDGIGTGFGTWVALLASAGLVVVGVMTAKSDTTPSTGGW